MYNGRYVFLMLCLFLWMSKSIAVLPQAVLSPSQYQNWLEITQSVRCMVCQNQSVYDSYAPFAEQVKSQVALSLQQGMQTDAIYQQLQASYGSQIMLKPPMDKTHLALWTGPLVFLLLASVFLWRKLRFRSDL